MKKWLQILTIFLMLKSGQEVIFHDGYEVTVMENGVQIAYLEDEMFLPMDEIRWITNDKRAHELLKGTTK